jgi:hypothetical protein
MTKYPGNSLYFHINNGGVSLEVEDTTHGPLLSMSASHFGHPTSKTGVYIKPSMFKDLAAFFTELSERKFCTPSHSMAPDYAEFANGSHRVERVMTFASGVGSTPPEK